MFRRALPPRSDAAIIASSTAPMTSSDVPALTTYSERGPSMANTFALYTRG
jgi:hypothetical protein